MKKSKMTTSRLSEAKAAFSRGIKVELDSITLLFISGTASVNSQGKTVHSGDFFAQVEHTYKNIVSLLEIEKACLKDVVKFTVFLRNMDDYEKFNQARDEFFDKSGLTREEFPASTCVEAKLCREDLLVEIETIAIIPKGGKL